MKRMKAFALSVSGVVIARAIIACSDDPVGRDEHDTAASDALVLQNCAAVSASAVTAIGFEAPNAPTNTIDGNASTRWSRDGVGSWIQYDLGASNDISSVSIAWYRGNTRRNKFVVSTSTDGQQYVPAYQGVSSGKTIAAESYAFAPRSARYVRVTVNGNSENTWASIAETRACAAPVDAGAGFNAKVDSSGAPSGSSGSTDAATASDLDSDGVIKLFPTNTNGSSWSLGTKDPNTQVGTYFDMEGDPATRGTEAGIVFYTSHGHNLTYADGSPDSNSFRLHIKASGGSQVYNWRNGAIANGYLSNPRDLKNFEATVYVRVRDFVNSHTSMTWIVRGGKHSGSNDPRSSSVGMSVPYSGQTPQAERELDHPSYDFVKLTPKFSYQLAANRWLAVKIVSYLVDAKTTRNRLYLDVNPFDSTGKPQNNFQVYTEWDDHTGTSTGLYSQAATWGGWLTTFRVDGWKSIDFANLSAREIVPPAQ